MFFLEFINYSDRLTKSKPFCYKPSKLRVELFKSKNFAILYVFEYILGEICCHYSIVIHFFQLYREVFGQNSLFRELLPK